MKNYFNSLIKSRPILLILCIVVFTSLIIQAMASIMHFRLTHWYEQARRDYDKGLYHALNLAKYKMCDPVRWGPMYWNIAQTLRIRHNKPLEALPWYQKILDDCPRSVLKLSARQIIEEIRQTQDITTPEQGESGSEGSSATD